MFQPDSNVIAFLCLVVLTACSDTEEPVSDESNGDGAVEDASSDSNPEEDASTADVLSDEGEDTSIDATSDDDVPGEETDAEDEEFLDYGGESNLGVCQLNSANPDRYVTVGFWRDSNCSGDPIAQNHFPINGTAGCYCWPGNSGANSADSFSCDPEARTITIVQYNSLTCGTGDDTPTEKTFRTEGCHQDIPPTIYSKVLDMGPCR